MSDGITESELSSELASFCLPQGKRTLFIAIDIALALICPLTFVLWLRIRHKTHIIMDGVVQMHEKKADSRFGIGRLKRRKGSKAAKAAA